MRLIRQGLQYRAKEANPNGGSGMYCTKCGTKLPRDARFCMNCGKRVAVVAPVSATTPSKGVASAVAPAKVTAPVVEPVAASAKVAASAASSAKAAESAASSEKAAASVAVPAKGVEPMGTSAKAVAPAASSGETAAPAAAPAKAVVAAGAEKQRAQQTRRVASRPFVRRLLARKRRFCGSARKAMRGRRFRRAFVA